MLLHEVFVRDLVRPFRAGVHGWDYRLQPRNTRHLYEEEDSCEEEYSYERRGLHVKKHWLRITMRSSVRRSVGWERPG